MKKLLQGAIVLFLFTASVALIQISCSKVDAQPQASNEVQANKILYQKFDQNNGPAGGIFMANYDGSDQHRLNIVFPAGYGPDNEPIPVLSPDCSKVFFMLTNTATGYREIFTCDTSGANLSSIVVCDNAIDSRLGGAY